MQGRTVICAVYLLAMPLCNAQGSEHLRTGERAGRQERDENKACADELRKIRAILQAIADTTINQQAATLAQKNRAIVSAMLNQLRSPDVRLNAQWLATFQDLRQLLALNESSNQLRSMQTLHQELLLKLQNADAQGAGSVSSVVSFQRMSKVTIRGISTSGYRPTYRVHYVRGSEPRLPPRTFDTICTGESPPCQAELTPCFYRFWAVDLASGKVCSDSITTRIGEGAAKQVDLHFRK